MKVLAVIGTARRKGNVSELSRQILEGAKVNNHEVELVNLYDYQIRDCMGCWKCVEKGTCVFKDDFQAILNKLKDADVVIIGSPVYWGNITSKMKTFF